MSGNTFGEIFRVTTFGESHGAAIGAVVDGCPAQMALEREFIQRELDKRRPGQSSLTTARNESDTVEILSGIFEGRTTGTPIALLIRNSDAHSSDYENVKNWFRPGHADYSYFEKYGIRDYRGGGRASGRETAARVAAGAIAKCFLAQSKINVVAGVYSLGKTVCESIDYEVVDKNTCRALSLDAAEKMAENIRQVQSEHDSLGGIIKCRVTGLPPGLGEGVFDKLDAEIGKAVLSIGAVKGIAFGSGFDCAFMRGSECNDLLRDNAFLSHHAGGVLGGLSNGDDLTFDVAVKPTPSIAREQESCTCSGENETKCITGRHDPAVVLRATVVVEAMTALVLADMVLRQRCARI